MNANLWTTSWLASMALTALAGCRHHAPNAPEPAAERVRPPATRQAPRLEGRSPDDAYGRPASVSRPSGAWTDPNRQQVPADARLMAEGKPQLKFAVPDNGWVYVTHPRQGRVYRGAVRRGENLALDRDGVLSMDNKPVWKTVVAESDTFKIYFKRD